MARARMLQRKISNNKDLARLAALLDERHGFGHGAQAVWLYTWSIPHLDCEGRMHGDPSVVRGAVVPRAASFTEDLISTYLEAMAEVGLVDYYTVDGDHFLAFRGFQASQPGLRKDREAPSVIPTPPRSEIVTTSTFNSGVAPDQLRSDSGLTPDQLRTSSGELRVKVKDQEKEKYTDAGVRAVAQAGAGAVPMPVGLDPTPAPVPLPSLVVAAVPPPPPPPPPVEVDCFGVPANAVAPPAPNAPSGPPRPVRPFAGSETAPPAENAPTAQANAPARIPLEDLRRLWEEATGVMMPLILGRRFAELPEVGRNLERWAASRKPAEDPCDVARRAFALYSEWVDGLDRRPGKTPENFMTNWATVQELLAGKRKPVPGKPRDSDARRISRPDFDRPSPRYQTSEEYARRRPMPTELPTSEQLEEGLRYLHDHIARNTSDPSEMAKVRANLRMPPKGYATTTASSAAGAAVA